MEGTTKIAAGAACALAVAAAGGCWLYGVHAAGSVLDRAALNDFKDVLPAEISARVDNYESGFFSKRFSVTLTAMNGISLGTFSGTARPGMNTTVELKRAADPVFDGMLQQAGITGLKDELKVSYSLWDVYQAGAESPPSIHVSYALEPLTVNLGGQCRMEGFQFDLETGDIVSVSAKSPSFICQAPGQPAVKFENYGFSLNTDGRELFKALNGGQTQLAQSSMQFNVGPVEASGLRFEDFSVSVRLEPGKARDSWTETIDFKLIDPASPALFLELGELGAIDHVKGTIEVEGITAQLAERFAQVFFLPEAVQSVYLTSILGNAIKSGELVIGVKPATVSLNGVEAKLEGGIEDQAGKDVLGRFHLESPAKILPADIINDLVDQGYLRREGDKVVSDLVFASHYGTANGVKIY